MHVLKHALINTTLLVCDVRCGELIYFYFSQRSVPFQAKQQERHILEISPSPPRLPLILSIISPPPPQLSSAQGRAAWQRCRVMMRTHCSLAGFPSHQAMNKGGPGPLGCSKYSLQHAPEKCLAHFYVHTGI